MATINGSNGDDLIDESSATGKVKIKGKDGDDTLKGGSGKDDIDGDDGNDSIAGNGGDDKLDGGDGDDTIDGGDGEDDIKGGKGKDTVLGGKGDDKIKGEDGDDHLDGGEGDDDIKGGKGDDTILGGDGEDKIKGDDGDDLIYAGAGDDDVKGGKGDDTVQGGLGNDKMDGGSGIDTAVYSGGIADYSFAASGSGSGSGGIFGSGKLFVTDLYAGDGDEGTDELKKFEFIYFEADDYTLDLTGANNVPLARDDSAATDEDSAVNISGAALLANDFDPDPGDVLTISAVDAAGANGGLITDNGNGTFTYDPNGAFEALAAGEPGTDTFTYTVTDGNGATDTATVTVSITGVNDAPVASDDTGSGNEDTVISGNVLDNDFDVDSTGLTAALLSGPANGSVVVNLDGSYSYTPDPDYNGTDSFTYTLSDGDLTDTATVTLTVDPVNDAPTVDATDPTAFVEDLDASAQNLFQTGTVNFDDIDSGDLIDITSSINDQPVWSGGILNGAQITALAGGLSVGVIDAAVPGSIPWTYDATLDLDFLGQGETITVNYTIVATDVFGQNGTDVISFVINGTNDDPTPADDNGAGFTTDEDSSFVTASVLFNDSDPDANDSFNVFSLDDSATVGNVSFLGGGFFSYDPNGQFEYLALGDTATDTFTYTISDGKGGTGTATATITIEGANDTPGAEILTFDTFEDLAEASIDLNALVGDVDNGDVLTISNVSVISGAPVAISEEGGVVSFDTTGFNALGEGESDSFVIQYTVTDDSGASNDSSVETVTVTINGLNDAPVALNGTGAANEASAPQVAFEVDLTTLTSDPDTNDNLSYELLSLQQILPGEEQQASQFIVPHTIVNGVLSIDAAQFGLDDGETANFIVRYAVIDDSGADNDTAIGEIIVTVTGGAGEASPPDNAQPVAGSAFYEGDDETEVSINLLGLASDDDLGDVLSIAPGDVEIFAQGREDAIVFDVSETGILTLDPSQFGLEDGEELTLIGSYTVMDDSGEINDSATGEITISIVGVPAPNPNTMPTAQNAVADISEGTLVSYNLRDLVDDADGDSLTFTSVGFGTEEGEIEAEFTIDQTGGAYNVVFDPAQFGADPGSPVSVVLAYTVDDGTGQPNSSASGQVTFNISDAGANGAPEAQDSTVSLETFGLTSGVVNLASLISDPDEDTLTITAAVLSGAGVTTQPVIGGTFVEIDFTQFALGEDDSTTALLTYTVDDGNGGTDTGEVTVELTGNRGPTTTPLAVGYDLDEDTGNIIIDLGAQVSDPDEALSELTVTVNSFGSGEEGGEVAFDYLDEFGAISAAPTTTISVDPSQFGLADGESFDGFLEFTVDDGNGAFNSTATGSISLNVVNPDTPATSITLNFDDVDDGSPDRFSVAVGVYEGFVLSDSARVIETNEVPAGGGRGGGTPFANGPSSEFNVLSSTGGELLGIYGRGASLSEPQTEGDLFDLESAFLSAVYRDGLTVTATGYTLETFFDPQAGFFVTEYVATGAGQEFIVDTSGTSQVFFDDAQFDSVSYVSFEATGGTANPALGGDGTQFMLDDVFIFL